MPTPSAPGDLRKDAGMTDSQSAGLPIRRDLTLVYVLSLMIALLMAIAALAGLLFPDTIYPTDELVLAFAPVDPFHLVVGLPILLVSMWLARRGKLVGLLCWPGALLYVLYNFSLNLLGVPFGALFLVYLLLVTLSAYTTIALVASIDAGTVRQQLIGRVPARAAGLVLAGLSGLFILIAVAGIITAFLSRRPVSQLETMLWIADLVTIGTASLVGGILLLRHRALGYTGGAGLLLAFSMLFFGLVPVLIFPAVYSGSPIDLVSLVMMAALGIVCLILFALFARGIVLSGSSATEGARS